MIADQLANWKLYAAGRDRLRLAFERLEVLAAAPPADGRLEIAGADVYALVQSYRTAPAAEKKWEAHRNYLDVQFIAAGREVIGWSPADRLVPDGDYNPAKDVLKFRDAPGSELRLEAGSFGLFYPGDGHKPGVQWDAPAAVRKIVVKVRL